MKSPQGMRTKWVNFDFFVDDVGNAFGHYLMARIHLVKDELDAAAISIAKSNDSFKKVRNPSLVNIIDGVYPGLVNLGSQFIIEK